MFEVDFGGNEGGFGIQGYFGVLADVEGSEWVAGVEDGFMLVFGFGWWSRVQGCSGFRVLRVGFGVEGLRLRVRES